MSSTLGLCPAGLGPRRKSQCHDGQLHLARETTLQNSSIDPFQDPLLTLRSLVALDCPADWSDRSCMVAILLIAVCYVAGLAVHYRWYEGTAKSWLTSKRPVDRA